MAKIAMASDHAGFEMKEELKKYLTEKGNEVVDFGTTSTESCDYPDYAHPAASAIENGECDFGVVMCGTGNGISMVMNHHKGIRCALCWLPELAILAKEHNNANAISLPARFIQLPEAKSIVDAYMCAEYEGGRHQRRIDKIPV